MGLPRIVCSELFQNRLLEWARGHLANPIDTYVSHTVRTAYHVPRSLKLPTAALQVVEYPFQREFDSHSLPPKQTKYINLTTIE